MKNLCGVKKNVVTQQSEVMPKKHCLCHESEGQHLPRPTLPQRWSGGGEGDGINSILGHGSRRNPAVADLKSQLCKSSLGQILFANTQERKLEKNITTGKQIILIKYTKVEDLQTNLVQSD